MSSVPGKACKKCGEEKPLSEYHRKRSNRDGYKNSCRDCCNTRGRAYYRANPEAKRQQNAVWRAQNVERHREMVRDHYRRNAEQVLARTTAYQRANPERVTKWSREYRERNPEKVAAWRSSEREYKATVKARYRGRLADADGHHTPADLALLDEYQGGLCWYCGALLADTGRHLDHKIPLSRGGSNWPANLCWACPTCNTSKGARTPDEFQGA